MIEEAQKPLEQITELSSDEQFILQRLEDEESITARHAKEIEDLKTKQKAELYGYPEGSDSDAIKKAEQRFTLIEKARAFKTSIYKLFTDLKNNSLSNLHPIILCKMIFEIPLNKQELPFASQGYPFNRIDLDMLEIKRKFVQEILNELDLTQEKVMGLANDRSRKLLDGEIILEAGRQRFLYQNILKASLPETES